MIRRFNYTNRHRIPHECIHIVVQEERDAPSSFTASLDLPAEFRLPGDAAVWLEAYSGPAQMRFSFGRAGQIRPPTDTRLSRFRPGEKVLFRVKVVDEKDATHRILAWADKLRPLLPEEAQAGRRSILPVESAELGEQIWALRWNDDVPVLQLNAAFRDPRDITAIARTDADFVALVYPAVIRQILYTLTLTDEIPPSGEDEKHPWLEFAEVGLGGGPQPVLREGDEISREEVKDWIERAVNGFCRQNAALRRYAEAKGAAANV